MDDRPSAWLAGAGLGLVLGSGVLLGAYIAHANLGLAAIGVFLGLFTFGLGIAPFSEWAARGAWAAVSAITETVLAWRKPPAPPAAPSASAAAEPEPEVPEPDHYTSQIDRLARARQFQVAHWHVFFRRLVAAGSAYGWDIRTLTDAKRETRVISQPGWNLGTGALVAAHLMAKDQGGTRLLVSETDWNAERLWERLPCPDGEPPEIAPPPYTRQQTPQNTHKATVEGVRADS